MIIHVTPINDIKEHIDSSTCDCNPSVENLPNGDMMVVHNSWDGREFIEALVEDENISKN